MIAVCQTTCRSFLYSDGRVAQLGERIHGMDEAAGSIPVTSTNFPILPFSRYRLAYVFGLQLILPPAAPESFQDLGGKRGQRVILDPVTDFNRIATDFTILDVRLTAHRKVQHHRNFFAAIGAHKVVLNRIHRAASIRILAGGESKIIRQRSACRSSGRARAQTCCTQPNN
jgi:hypothetical protein